MGLAGSEVAMAKSKGKLMGHIRNQTKYSAIFTVPLAIPAAAGFGRKKHYDICVRNNSQLTFRTTFSTGVLTSF